ncbi:ABC transporter ATP-binding protein [Amycolatopsis saalfeldensis]|uniref:Peptide/nickel transport system ATP-binding protein n=1 Tax=Amycolatopsis saalfeldensis TaxID=394193 RepID=A0A1H8XY31_9PSEU|nr:ABC transporter ATP-binding protein [Amycolatopsis saalfeldensis]SEP44769.1 peptide/nickel transport system ATP-binding protein [Amycolatopsis saalfeldensis]
MTDTQTERDMRPVLSVEGLSLGFHSRDGVAPVLDSVSFDIGRGEAFGLVGESGCGKSTVAYSIVRYLAANARVTGGSVRLDGRDVLTLGGRDLRRLRASAVSMVYQDPSRALNPSMRIWRQVAEVYELAGKSGSQARRLAVEALDRVQIPRHREVARRYPHELSGGMQQRVVIAMALAAQPALLILDEPTTALDATVEAGVLDLIAQLRAEHATSVLFITHDLRLVSRMCDRVGVLYAGRLVEVGPSRDVLSDPHHPYTAGLLRAVPRGTAKGSGPLEAIPGALPSPGSVVRGCAFADRCALVEDRCRTESPGVREVGDAHVVRCFVPKAARKPVRLVPVAVERPPADPAPAPLLSIRGLTKTYGPRGAVSAVAGVDLEVFAGEVLALVGESGSGKTTLGHAVAGLVTPSSGTVEYRGKPLAGRADRRSDDEVTGIQVIFQNPDSALNRRHTVRRLLGRAVTRLAGLRGERLVERVTELAHGVALPDRCLDLRPKQLSGGLKQRVAIARAFAGDPALVVCDEPTSALDVSVQATILNLLVRLQGENGVACLFISHDLGVVRYLADRIAVMYRGRIVEVVPAERIIDGPRHPYTEVLMSAADPAGGRSGLPAPAGSALSSHEAGCVFSHRCPRRLGPLCDTDEPPLADAGGGQLIRCHLPVADLGRTGSAPEVHAG